MLNLDDYVVDVLMRDLVGHDRRPAAFLIYLWLTSEQARRQGAVQVSHQELAESVGLSKSSAQAAVSWLVRRKLLTSSKENATAVRGLGLTSMQERVRLINGIIEIQSKPMGGTTVHVRVPLRSEHSQRAAG